MTRVAVLDGGGTDAVVRARAAGADVICLPQLSVQREHHRVLR